MNEKTPLPPGVANGDICRVIAGAHAGKKGVVQDLKRSKTGHTTITVAPADAPRFKTLARNVIRVE